MKEKIILRIVLKLFEERIRIPLQKLRLERNFSLKNADNDREDTDLDSKMEDSSISPHANQTATFASIYCCKSVAERHFIFGEFWMHPIVFP